MQDLLIDHPSPNFGEMVCVLYGEQPPQRVPLVGLGIDPEICQIIQESFLGEPWALPRGVGMPLSPDADYYRQLINIYYRLGYDFVPLYPIWVNNPSGKIVQVADTAQVSRGVRDWVDESGALIRSWQDFEEFPWDRIYAAPETFEMVARFMPEGMKATVSASLFENIFEAILGYKGLFFLMRKDPSLVEAVFNRCGQVVYDFYKSAIELDIIGAIFHADDMGYRTGTMISPKDLHHLLFPG
jgi:uroporphyrinogen decarboxylase